MGHSFSRQITEKCGTKYGNENYILEHPKWKWELYFGMEGVLYISYSYIPSASKYNAYFSLEPNFKIFDLIYIKKHIHIESPQCVVS